jgi:hypothetical protein
MIRLTALRSRIQMSIAAAGLAAVAVVLLVTGPHLVDLYRSQIETCSANHDCSAAQAGFLRTDRTAFGLLGFLVLVVPALVGVFLGAPLVARELETGTHRLAWTQGVSRTRWLAVKVAVAGIAGMALAGLVSLFVTWWAHPLDRVRMDQYAFFDQRGVVPVAHAAFAVALGIACGILLRRTLPAMAATLAGFVAVRLAFTYYVRAHLLPPAHITTTLSSGNGLGFEVTPPLGVTFVTETPNVPNAMVLSSRLVDHAGTTVTARRLHDFVTGRCPAIANPSHSASLGPANPGAFNHCIHRLSASFRLATTYQPPSRYWPLQWSEFGVFMAAALILVGVSFWRIRRAHG